VSNHDDRNELGNPAGRFGGADDDGTRDLFGLGDAADLALVADLDQLREVLANPAVWIEPPQDVVQDVARTISAAANRERERDAKYEQLRDWWHALCRGDSQISRMLLVDGAPGVGKTRLVAELARSIESEGGLVLWGRCDEHPSAPLQPVVDALEHYFDSVSGDVIRQLPRWQLTELARYIPLLRDHLPTARKIRGDLEIATFFAAITQTVNDLSARGRLLLVVDDLHLADKRTLVWLRQFLLSSADLPNIGIIATLIEPDFSDRYLSALWKSPRGPSAHVHLPGSARPR
jgi:hypothetical protein